MKNWKTVKLGEATVFNPVEKLPKNTIAKKVAMECIDPYTRQISRFEESPYLGGAKFRNGDTLFARITPCLENGKTAHVTFLENDEVGFGSTEFIVLRANHNVTDPVFVYYLFLSDAIRTVAIKSMVGTSGRQRVQQDVLENLEISLPPIEEQRRIAGILGCLDAKIELNRRMNANLEAQAAAIFKNWFVDFEPFRDAGMTDSPLGKIPKGWRVGKLGEILETIETGKRPKGGIDHTLREGIASIGAESINGIGTYDFSKTKYVSEEFFRGMSRGIVKDFDVLIYKDGAYIGKKAMFGNQFPFENCAVNEHVFILRCNQQSNQFHLYFALDSAKLSELNTNSAQPGINQESMKSFDMIIPPTALTQQFEKIAKPLIEMIFTNATESRVLSSLRDTLLPRLMRGEL